MNEANSPDDSVSTLPWPFNTDPRETLAVVNEVLNEMPPWLRSGIMQQIGYKVIERLIRERNASITSTGHDD